MAGLYIFIVLLCRVVQAFFNKRSSNEIQNTNVLVGFNAFQNAVSALLGLILILVAGNGFRADWLTLLIATVSGVSLFFSGFWLFPAPEEAYCFFISSAWDLACALASSRVLTPAFLKPSSTAFR